MKKVIYNQYGDARQLQVVETDKPVPGSRLVLIKMKAAAINPLDWKIRNGEMKLFTGSRFPKGIGFDFAGAIESVGASVKDFSPGDAVFGTITGFTAGTLAEYIVVDAKTTMIKPPNISFEQATALSTTGATALRILEDVANVKKGTQVLINGATGGVGMFATQIAKRMGAVVTAVVSPKGIAVAKEWGSDHIIDYTSENVLERGILYDVVVDLSDKLPFQAAKAIMKDKSIFVNTIPSPPQIVASKLFSPFTNKKNKALVTIVTKKDLKSLADYATDGLDIQIHKTYSMGDVVDGFMESEKGGAIGKTVFTIDQSAPDMEFPPIVNTTKNSKPTERRNTMGKAYMLAFVEVSDFEKFKKDYIIPSVPITFRHGGKLLAASDEVTVREGSIPPGWAIILEFPSMKHAEAFYEDPEYANLIKVRENMGTSSLGYFSQGQAPGSLKRTAIKIALKLGLGPKP